MRRQGKKPKMPIYRTNFQAGIWLLVKILLANFACLCLFQGLFIITMFFKTSQWASMSLSWSCIPVYVERVVAMLMAGLWGTEAAVPQQACGVNPCLWTIYVQCKHNIYWPQPSRHGIDKYNPSASQRLWPKSYGWNQLPNFFYDI